MKGEDNVGTDFDLRAQVGGKMIVRLNEPRPKEDTDGQSPPWGLPDV